MEAYRLGAVQYLVRPKEESEMFPAAGPDAGRGRLEVGKAYPFQFYRGVVNLRLSDVLYGKKQWP